MTGVRAVRRRVRRRAFRFLSRNAEAPMVRAAARAASSLLSATQNDDGDPEHDGEFAVLQRLAAVRPRLVLDVGAHTGAWTVEALRLFPDAVSHAFEPAPPTFARLEQNVSDHPRTVVHRVALSDRSGEAEMGFDAGHPETASLLSGNGAGQRFTMACQTGDEFLAAQGIGHVDYLKVDVEGHDLSVLRGFRQALSTGVVDVVQFEFGPWNAITRTWLYDFFAELPAETYLVGRIFPSRVRFADYHYSAESFACRQNFVAVRRDRPDLIAALR